MESVWGFRPPPHAPWDTKSPASTDPVAQNTPSDADRWTDAPCGGVTGLALLAESHISIHTWPELGYAAVDVFTCGDHTMPEQACRELAARLQSGEQRLQSLRRDTPPGLPTPSRALARP